MSRAQRACPTGKKRYDSHFAALVEVWKCRALLAMGHTGRQETRVYGPCKRCHGGWHLTSED